MRKYKMKTLSEASMVLLNIERLQGKSFALCPRELTLLYNGSRCSSFYARLSVAMKFKSKEALKKKANTPFGLGFAQPNVSRFRNHK